MGFVFSKENIESIIAGRKTMTRRLAKDNELFVPNYEGVADTIVTVGAVSALGTIKHRIKYQVGREYMLKAGRTLPQVYWRMDDNGDIELAHTHLMPHLENGKQPTQLGFAKRRFSGEWRDYLEECRYQPLSYRITSLRQERLQEITEKDAIAEGIERNATGRMYKDYTGMRTGWTDATDSYATQWNMLHKKQANSWGANPLVNVIGIEVV